MNKVLIMVILWFSLILLILFGIWLISPMQSNINPISHQFCNATDSSILTYLINGYC